MNIGYTHRSSNAKVGKIPVTTSSKRTCPTECPMLDNGCYASAGFHTNMHWDKVTSGERGAPIDALCEQVRRLPEGQLWRHNVAGDLMPTSDGKIDSRALWMLTAANTGRRGFTYTHYAPTGENLEAIEGANRAGFTVNISANSPREALDVAQTTTAPVVTIVPSDFWSQGDTVGSIVRCPAETRDEVTCKTCKLCSVATRKTIVGFTVHGTQAKKADIIARAV
jgi:hypothetical protein